MSSSDDAGETPRPSSGQLIFELGHTPSLVEADFLVSDGNALAFEHICAYPAWSGPLMLISGPAKVGKSHMGRIWVARANARVAVPDELEALAGAGGQGPVLLEDVDRLDYDEQALFHLLNQSMRDNRPLLMTARKPISEWGYNTDDVRSRARLAAHFAVAMPGDTQLSQMFAKLFADRQIDVDAKIVAYLVARMERSAAEVAALVALMDKLALTRRGAITRAIAAEALEIRSSVDDTSDGEANGE